VSIVKSFAAPEQAILDDGELLQERVRTTATSLLSLLGIDADPVQSREHILLSTLLSTAWQGGQDLDLAALIAQIQSPPDAARRRARPRLVLPREGSLCARDAPEQPACCARV
jgi:hypothetical protein